jgi:hypothetical protein
MKNQRIHQCGDWQRLLSVNVPGHAGGPVVALAGLEVITTACAMAR